MLKEFENHINQTEGPKIKPPAKKSEIKRFTEILQSSLERSLPLESASPICPDYSFHLEDGRPIYDFKSLNDGVGLNGGSLLKQLPKFIESLSRIGIKSKHIMFVADVEAYDDLILKSVGLTRDEFLTKIEMSSRELQIEANRFLGPNVEVRMMSSVINESDKARAADAIAKIDDHVQTIDSIAASRASLYNRWFSKVVGKKSVSEFDDFFGKRARIDILKYLEFGFAMRRMGLVIVEATAPSIARLYNFGDGYVDKRLPGLKPIPVFMIDSDY